MENAQEMFQSMNKQNGDEVTLSIGESIRLCLLLSIFQGPFCLAPTKLIVML